MSGNVFASKFQALGANVGEPKLSDIEETTDDYRAEIALRNRRRKLESRNHKIMMVVFGLLAYSAFANFAAGAMQLIAGSGWDAGFAAFLGLLYVVGAYRVWIKGDTRWWPVALPAILSIVFLLLVWWATGSLGLIPLLLNITLLVLVPIRARANAASAAVHNAS